MKTKKKKTPLKRKAPRGVVAAASPAVRPGGQVDTEHGSTDRVGQKLARLAKKAIDASDKFMKAAEEELLEAGAQSEIPVPPQWEVGDPCEVVQPKGAIEGRIARLSDDEHAPGQIFVELTGGGRKRAAGQWFPIALVRRPGEA